VSVFGIESLFSRLAAGLRSLARGQGQIALLFFAAVGGVAAGLGTAGLVKGIDITDRILFDHVAGALPFGRFSIVPIVAAGALVAGLISYYLGRDSRGHGVPDVMYAFEHGGGRMTWRVTLSGALATIATIGAGGSAGQEGPSVHIGAGLSSLTGRVLGLGQEQRRLLIAVGAAGGISAVFNAPLTGSFFALEVVLRRFTVRNFSGVVLGAVLANAVYRGLLGNEQLLRSPAYDLRSASELPGYAVLGVLTAVVAVAFVRTLYMVEGVAANARWRFIATAIGGALVGVIGVWHGEVLGEGVQQTASFLRGDGGAQLLLVLLALKVLATSLTLGSGGTGGVFMPSLFLGAALGGAFGVGVDHLAPALSAPAGAYAVAGMAGVFAGAAAAPITALMLAVEVSQDYALILPLMVVVVLSVAVTQLLMRETIYSEGLKRIGIEVSSAGASERLAALTVESMMEPARCILSPEMTLDEARVAFARSQVDLAPVVELRDGKVAGMLSSRDLVTSITRPSGEQEPTVGDVMTQPAVVIRQEESVRAAAHLMERADIRALAVVDKAGGIVGIIGRGSVLASYTRATTPELLPATELQAADVIRVRVRPGGPLDGATLASLDFPAGSLVVSVRRRGTTFVPRGSLQLRAGDRLVVLAEPAARTELVGRGIVPAPSEGGSRFDQLARLARAGVRFRHRD
jgi:CIC family chloride channel protein